MFVLHMPTVATQIYSAYFEVLLSALAISQILNAFKVTENEVFWGLENSKNLTQIKIFANSCKQSMNFIFFPVLLKMRALTKPDGYM